MKPRCQSFWLSSSLTLLWLVTTCPLQAQPVPDGTLPSPSIVNQNSNTSVITGGTQVSSNLFHSFREFSVPRGTAASFQQIDQRIENIISRVTGFSASNIDGLIQVLQANGTINSANFFLVNPNGIFFGPNATLAIGGSFVATTASSLKFANGRDFSATDPSTSPLLTVSVPIGLQFGQNPGSISANGSNLRVPQDKTIALLGGALTLSGSNLTAPSGQIELGSVAGIGMVSLTPIDTGWTFGYEGIQNFQDIELSQAAFVDASGTGGGNIQVQGQRVILTGGAGIEASTLGSESGGILSLNASESLELIGTSENGQFPSELVARVAPGATGNGGVVTIQTEKLFVQDGARVLTSTFGQGNAGAIAVRASEVQLNGYPSGLFTTAEAGARGDGGELTIETEQLLVQNGAQVLTSSRGEGYAGNLTVRATDVELVGIGTSADGEIIVSGLLATDEASTLTSSSNTSPRTGGNLSIDTEQLLVRDGAQVAVTTFSGKDAGDLTVRAAEVQLIGASILTEDGLPAVSGLFAGTDISSTGAGGNLTIETGRLIIQDGAEAQASTLGDGNAGSLIVRASESVELSGKTPDGQFPSALLASSGFENVFTEAQGKGGNIEITTPQLLIRDGAEVTVSSTNSAIDAQGAGDIEITAQTMRLDNQGAIAATTASGNGGNITLNDLGLLLLRRSSIISTQAGNQNSGGGNGGNITINAETGFVVAIPQENSDIIANAFEGNGGNITLRAQSIFGLQPRNNELAPRSNTTSDITASSRSGLAGTVNINTPDLDPSRGLLNLPTDLVDASNQIAVGCTVGGESVASNKFIITGRGGLPPNPTETLNGEAVLTNWVNLEPGVEDTSSSFPTSNHSRETVTTQIVEAQGWATNSQGEVILTASAPTVIPNTSVLVPTSCASYSSFGSSSFNVEALSTD